MNKKKPQSKAILNRRAKFDYIINDSYVVGLELTGAEAKALRMGLGQLTGSYVTIKDNQLLLVNTLIKGNGSIKISEVDQVRDRRLLAKRREIDHMVEAKVQGKTIIPLEILTQGRYIKLRIALAQGKKNYDKRQALKAKNEQLQIDAAMKYRSFKS